MVGCRPVIGLTTNTVRLMTMADQSAGGIVVIDRGQGFEGEAIFAYVENRDMWSQALGRQSADAKKTGDSGFPKPPVAD